MFRGRATARTLQVKQVCSKNSPVVLRAGIGKFHDRFLDAGETRVEPGGGVFQGGIIRKELEVKGQRNFTIEVEEMLQ